MRRKMIPPVHPGEILMEEFLKPLGISQYKSAKDISVPARRINEIVHASVPSPPIRPSDCPAISTCRKGFG
jgi:plasmid maintenance system antidote protein VapI